MSKDSNIVHQYFRKQFPRFTLLVKVNPLDHTATEITVYKDRDPELRLLESDAGMVDNLTAEGFTEASAIEFNLYLSGLIK